MEPCSFCGKTIPFGTGKMYVRKDAKIQYFCSRKCEKNLLELKRNPRNYGYTAVGRVTKKQRMATLAHTTKDEAPKAEAKPKAKPAAKKAAKPKEE